MASGIETIGETMQALMDATRACAEKAQNVAETGTPSAGAAREYGEAAQALATAVDRLRGD